MIVDDSQIEEFTQKNKKMVNKLKKTLMRANENLNDEKMIDMDFEKHLTKLQERVKLQMFPIEIELAKKNYEKAKKKGDEPEPTPVIVKLANLTNEQKDIVIAEINVARECLDGLFYSKLKISNECKVEVFVNGVNSEVVDKLSETLKTFDLGKFEFGSRTDTFRIWSYLLPLIESPYYLVKLIQQMAMYEKIKKTLVSASSNIDDLLDMGDGDLADTSESLSNKTFRFGDAFRSLFSGYEFQTVCKSTLLLLYVKISRICIRANPEGLRVDMDGTKDTESQLIYPTVVDKLEEFLGVDVTHFKYNLLSKKRLLEQTTESGSKFRVDVSTNFLNKLATAELNTLVAAGLPDVMTYSVQAEVAEIWALCNMVSEGYTCFTYASHHYSQAFLEFNTIYLYLNKTAEETSMAKMHRNMSLKKALREAIFDFCYLMFYYGFEELPSENKISILVFKANEGLLTSTRQEAIFDYKAYKNANGNLCQAAKLIVKKHLKLDASFGQVAMVQEFLSSKENITILKKNDGSYLVNKFLNYNRTLEQQLNCMAVKDYKIKILELTDPLIPKGLDKKLGIKFDKISINKVGVFKKHLANGVETRDSLLKKLFDENTILENVACFDNLKKMYTGFLPSVHKTIEECTAKGLNKEVPAALRFEMYDDKHLRLPDKLRNDVKDGRRMKIEDIIPVTLWVGTLRNIFKQMYWKVQSGLITWYYIFAYMMDYEKTVLGLLKNMKMEKVKTRVTAIKVFGILTKLYKLAKNVGELNGYNQVFKEPELQLPPDHMMDIDTTFGLTETSRNDNAIWDKEFFEHLYEWMNRDTRERLYGIDVVEDFKLAMCCLAKDMKPTNSTITAEEGKEIIYLQESYLYEREQEDRLKENFKVNPEWLIMKQANTNNFKYSTFSDKARNFYNFSASGSAQKFTLPTCETPDLKKLAETEPELYNKIKAQFAVEETEEGAAYKPKSGSKTICFAYTGEYLSKILYWVYGNSYVPNLNHVIKKEPKKLRHVINSDLVSFVKQTYFHDWVTETLCEANKCSINSLLGPRDRLLFLRRMASTLNEEKWCVELDMKDFHIHFGQSHYEAVSEVFIEVIQDAIKCPRIRHDMKHVLTSFKYELAKGKMSFRLASEEKNLFKDLKYDKENCKISVRKFKDKDKRANKDSEDEELSDDDEYEDLPDNILPENLDDIALENENATIGKNGKSPSIFCYDITFKVNNGLISGWKLTSLFGSTFNLTLNKMCELWTMSNNPSILFNLNVLGDDTHLKRRYLSDSLNHVCFINMINKVAHPDKQMISTVMIEFLKKKVNTVSQTIQNSNVNILGTLTTKKENFKRTEVTDSYIISNIDVINTFLSRLSHPYVRECFLKNSIAFKYLHQLLNFQKNTNTENFIKLLNSPSTEVGIVAGPLRNFCTNFNFEQEVITQNCIRYEVYKQLKILEWDFRGEICHGMVSSVGRVSKCFSKYLKGGSRVNKFGTELMMKMMSEIKDNNAIFFNARTKEDKEKNPKNNFVVFKENSPEDNPNAYNPVVIYGFDNKSFNLHKFIEFAFRLIELGLKGGVDYQNIVGELIYHNEDVSDFLYRSLKNSGNVDSSEEARLDIFTELRDLKRHCECNESLFRKFCDIYDYTDFFELALSNKMSVSISKHYQHDEIIGYLNDCFTRFLVFYLLEVQRVEAIDFMPHFRNVINTLDYYLHQNVSDILKKLETILVHRLGVLTN